MVPTIAVVSPRRAAPRRSKTSSSFSRSSPLRLSVSASHPVCQTPDCRKNCAPPTPALACRALLRSTPHRIPPAAEARSPPRSRRSGVPAVQIRAHPPWLPETRKTGTPAGLAANRTPTPPRTIYLTRLPIPSGAARPGGSVQPSCFSLTAKLHANPTARGQDCARFGNLRPCHSAARKLHLQAKRGSLLNHVSHGLALKVRHSRPSQILL